MSDDRPEIERAGKAALAKITEQLEWRGPGGKQMGHVVLKRDVAEAVRKYFDDLGDQIRDAENAFDDFQYGEDS